MGTYDEAARLYSWLTSPAYDPTDRAQCRFQLMQEGHRRAGAFISEDIFLRVLRQTGHVVADGWLVATPPGRGAVWLRIGDGEWNEADRAFAARIADSGAVWYVAYRDGLVTRQWTAQGWQPPQPFAALLTATNPPSPALWINPMRAGDEDYLRRSVSYLLDSLSEDDLRLLSVRRAVIWLLTAHWRVAPYDFDSVILTPDGSLSVMGIKLKYPTSNGLFGVDLYEARRTRVQLERLGIAHHHALMINPSWDKRVGPADLIESGWMTYAPWLALQVDEGSFGQARMRTLGADCGMYQERRDQMTLRVEQFTYLGDGYPVGGMRSYLQGAPGLPSLGLRELRNQRAAYSQWRRQRVG